jgi:hypothetical protein
MTQVAAARDLRFSGPPAKKNSLQSGNFSRYLPGTADLLFPDVPIAAETGRFAGISLYFRSLDSDILCYSAVSGAGAFLVR